MREDRNSLILSFVLGSLAGGGAAVLATQYFFRKRYAKATRMTSDANLTQGDYCAPEGADLHYDLDEEDDEYYSESRI